MHDFVREEGAAASRQLGGAADSPSQRSAGKTRRGCWFASGMLAGVLVTLVLSAVGIAAFFGEAGLLPPGLSSILPFTANAAALDEDERARMDEGILKLSAVAEGLAVASEGLAAAAAYDPLSADADTRLEEAREAHRDALDAARKHIEDAGPVFDSALSVLGQAAANERNESDRALLEQASSVLEALSELVSYEQEMDKIQKDLGSVPMGSQDMQMADFYKPAWDASLAFSGVKAPSSIGDLHECYVALWEPVATYLYGEHESSQASVLELRAVREILDWVRTREYATLSSLHAGVAQQYRYLAAHVGAPATEDPQVEVSWQLVDRLQPNLYPTLDYVLDLRIVTEAPLDVTVEAQIDGFTQGTESLRSLEAGVTHILVKPQMLSELSAAGLETGRTAQLSFKLVDGEGNLLEAQSVDVELLSIYDFFWTDAQTRAPAQLSLTAWLRPTCDHVLELNRRAASYMGQWTDGQFEEMAGYQYGDDWYATLLQTASIQKALSDAGISYVVDTYSPRADQRILTPQAVFARQQALCVETSLVVASCLMSAEMHPYIIVTPTHAQVAVESWADSGSFFLIETSLLPYEGPDRFLAYDDPAFWGGLVPLCEDENGSFTMLEGLGSSEQWDRFIAAYADGSDAYGGVYVIDCAAQRAFGFYGLESF